MSENQTTPEAQNQQAYGQPVQPQPAYGQAAQPTYGQAAQPAYGQPMQPQYQMPQPTPYQMPAYQVGQPVDGNDYKPISMWGYFGYELLFSIPCVGFILLLVFSFGGTKNINVRNFARSYFCLCIVMVVLVVLIALVCGGIGALSLSNISRNF